MLTLLQKNHPKIILKELVIKPFQRFWISIKFCVFGIPVDILQNFLPYFPFMENLGLTAPTSAQTKETCFFEMCL